MRSIPDRRSDRLEARQSGQALWMALIVASGICLTPLFACAAPFAALATLAALKLGRRDMIAVMVAVWSANQAIGYGMLGYPWSWDSAAWGIAIGMSCGLAVLAAKGLSTTGRAPLAVSLPFVGAFATFELGLYVAGFMLPGSDEAFSFAVIEHIFLINVSALFGLVVIYHSTMLVGRLAGTGAALPHGLGATTSGR